MFDAGEVRRGDRVALVNETAAKLWPAGENPIGARVRARRRSSGRRRRLLRRHERVRRRSRSSASWPTRKNAGLRDRAGAGARRCRIRVVGAAQRMLAVRTAGDPNLQLNPIRAQVREMDRRPAARPSVHARRSAGAGGRAAAVHDGAVQRVRGAGAGARRRRHLQRAVVPRDAADARARRADGARRAARARARSDVEDGRTAWSLVGLAVGMPASLAATRLLRSQLFGVRPPIRSPTRPSPSCSAWWRSPPATFRRAARPPSIRCWRSGRSSPLPPIDYRLSTIDSRLSTTD